MWSWPSLPIESILVYKTQIHERLSEVLHTYHHYTNTWWLTVVYSDMGDSLTSFHFLVKYCDIFNFRILVFVRLAQVVIQSRLSCVNLQETLMKRSYMTEGFAVYILSNSLKSEHIILWGWKIEVACHILSINTAILFRKLCWVGFYTVI